MCYIKIFHHLKNKHETIIGFSKGRWVDGVTERNWRNLRVNTLNQIASCLVFLSVSICSKKQKKKKRKKERKMYHTVRIISLIWYYFSIYKITLGLPIGNRLISMYLTLWLYFSFGPCVSTPSFKSNCIKAHLLHQNNKLRSPKRSS